MMLYVGRSRQPRTSRTVIHRTKPHSPLSRGCLDWRRKHTPDTRDSLAPNCFLPSLDVRWFTSTNLDSNISPCKYPPPSPPPRTRRIP